MRQTGTCRVNPENTSHCPVIIDPELCTGCNRCLEVCPADLFLPNRIQGQPPHVVFGSECWYEGSCVAACPVEAIRLVPPLTNRVHWKPRSRP
jgi:NAD-dependent dihydropyrimidine dehydrogenase PreA subunit